MELPFDHKYDALFGFEFETRHCVCRTSVRSVQALSLELHADADWAGLWNAALPDDPTCVKSRTGYLITLCGDPVTWDSKLQTEIATSTMHSEYMALSTGMRDCYQ